MTDVPDWVTAVPPAPVHSTLPFNYQIEQLTQDQLNGLRGRLIASILQVVLQAIRGFFIPAGNTIDDAFDQLRDWAESIPAAEQLIDLIEELTGLDLLNPDTWPIIGDIIEIFTGVEDGDVTDLGTWFNNTLGVWFQGIAEGKPFLEQIGALIESIVNGFFTWIQGLLGPLGFSVTPVEITAWLESLPTIEEFLAQITGIPFGDPEDLQAWADQQTRNTREFWNRIAEAMDINHDGNVDLNDAIAAIQLIPGFNVLGTGGPPTATDTWQQFWDGLWAAITGGAGTGKSMADVNSAANQLAAYTANHEATLGLRDNKPIFTGLDSTTESVFPITQLDGGHYLALTNSWSTVGFIRTAAKVNYGRCSWMGYNTASVTALYLDVYWMDPGTGDMSYIFSSPNLISEVSDALAWNTWDFDVLGADPSDIWGIRMKINGAGTYYVAGIDVGTQPLHPSALPHGLGAFMLADSAYPGAVSPAFIAEGDVTYDNDVPWFGLAVGDVGYHTPVLAEFTSSDTYTIPPWAIYVDLAIIGGGGGARSGDLVAGNGEGGRNAVWTTSTLVRGTDFHVDATSMTVTIGGGGAGSLYGNPNPGANSGGAGGTTTISFTNPGSTTSTRTSTGGASSVNNGPAFSWNGLSPGNVDYMGRTFYGGATETVPGGSGNGPGGGGAGGTNYFGANINGGPGAPGIAWIQGRQS